MSNTYVYLNIPQPTLTQLYRPLTSYTVELAAKLVNTLCLILMNIMPPSDSSALFIFSYSYSAVTSKIKAHHSSKIKLREAPSHRLLHARSYGNGLPVQRGRGRQRHHHRCQHHKKKKKWQKLCLINTPGAQSKAFSLGLSKQSERKWRDLEVLAPCR